VATLSAEAVVASAPQRWFLPTPEPLARTSAGMAVRKGDPDFLAFLNTWLDMNRESGWLAQRARHWATSTAGFR
jgi:polar amino acid transport system substrate-binding protein